MKLLDVTEFYSARGGGVRSYLNGKAEVACALGHDHLVIAPGERDEERVLPYPGPGRARVRLVKGRALPYDPSYRLLSRVAQVRQIVQEERPDVLEMHSPYLAAAACLSTSRRYLKLRTFVWHADFIDTYLRPAIERQVTMLAADLALAPLWAGVRRIAARCDATIVAASWQREKLKQHGVSRVEHVPFGVERAHFTPLARSEAERARWLGGAPKDAKLLVGIGRFAVEKRWDVVLEAFKRACTTQPLVLVLFGDGPERASMEAQVAGRNDVHFAGFTKDREELARGLACADLLVHGCPFETFGLGIAEAMSTGLPAVVPDAGGAAELVDEAGGERYRSGDPVACAAAIRRALGRDQIILRAGALGSVTAHVPSIEGHFSQLFELYRSRLEHSKLTQSRLSVQRGHSCA